MASSPPTVQEAAPPGRWTRALTGETAALRELAGSYWYAVYFWWRRAGRADAGDLTQACFARWLSDAPPRAEQAGAERLREWLLAQLRALATQELKAVTDPAIEIAPEWAEERYAQEPAGEADEVFQRRWALTVLEFAMEALRAEYAARGQEALFAEVSPYASFEGGDDERYTATAGRLHLSVGGARKAVYDFRSRHQELLRAFVVDTVADPNDINSELTALLIACDTGGGSAPLPSAIKSFKPDELLARAMRSVRMTSGGGGIWTPPSDEEVAALFPQYEMLGLLGRGGMGAVYKARQVSLDRFVAIKLLPLEISVDKDFADRFRREARAMAKLNHPNIISVYDFGQTSEGHLYFTMQFVEGPMLHTLIHGAKGEEAGGTLTPDVALELVEQVCDALAYAHELGIVHRDIKPANVMVDLRGKVKVADFGLARMAEADPAQWGSTMTGVVMGTPDYMAPEQKRGLHVDHRADIYALGALLYEALCQETPQGVFEMPSKKRGLDKRLDAIIAKALANSPDARYQSTLEMKAAIEAVRPAVTKTQAKTRKAAPATKAATALPKPAPGPGMRSRAALYAGVAIVIGLLSAGVVFFKSRTHAEAGHPSPDLRAGVEQDARNSRAPVGTGASPEDDATPAAASNSADWANAVHLLPLLDLKKDVMAAPWTLEGGKLKSGFGNNPRVQLPYQPPAEYDYRIVFSYTDLTPGRRLGQVQQILSKDHHLFAWVLGSQGGESFAFETVGGKTAGNPENPTRKVRPQGIEKAKTHTSIVEVRNDRVRAFLDGELLSEWKTDYQDLDAKPEWKLPARDTLGVGSYQTAVVIEQLDVREVSGQGKLTRAPTGAGGATIAAPFVNTLGMKFVPVPITGGSSGGQRVLFSIWETRVQDYELFVTETKRSWSKPSFAQGPTHPAVLVNWDDAQAYCTWLTERERAAGKLSPQERYRLPTDHEWSCAVGLGELEDPTARPEDNSGKLQNTFPWGNLWPPPREAGNFQGEEVSEQNRKEAAAFLKGRNDGFAETAPVGSFAANRFGIFDLAGNASEWCEDPSERGRLLRGGSFREGQVFTLAATYRRLAGPFTSDDRFGFRTILAPDPGVAAGANPKPAPSNANTVISATKDASLVNSLGMKFVPVPIPRGPSAGLRVLFSIWETRVQDYEAFVQETKRAWEKPPFEQGPTHPALNMNWSDAKAFCAWLTDRERKAGRLAAGEVCRLPTDYEWSCAVGLGEVEDPAKTPDEKTGKVAGVYPWGKSWPPPPGAGNYSGEEAIGHEELKAKDLVHEQQILTGYRDDFPLTAPVGSFTPNQWGIFDLGGNAWEWCEDQNKPGDERRILRGASFVYADRFNLLSSNRGPKMPDQHNPNCGFRVVVAAPSSAEAEKEQPFVNSLGMRFVPVPITGGPTDRQRVLFSVWETRVQDYEAFAQETKREWLKPRFLQSPAHPVVNVSWDEAQAFCGWLTARERAAGRIRADEAYRLPRDHEWSCAVGIGEQEAASTESPRGKGARLAELFPWGAWPPPPEAGNFSGTETAGHTIEPDQQSIPGYEDRFANTAPVGSFAANQLGLFDLSGNVWEWCEDLYGETGPNRTVRGGAFSVSEPARLASAARGFDQPGSHTSTRGFRVVLAAGAAPLRTGPSAPPAAATREAPFANTLGMKLVPVPITGGPSSGQRVLFSIWETRVQDYEVFARETRAEWIKPDFAQTSAHPAVNVSWGGALAFCAWLTERERKIGQLHPDEEYRLPTDHEWSCAAGIGEREDAAKKPLEKSGKIADLFPWGTAWPPPAGAGNFSGEEVRGHFTGEGQEVMKGYRDDFPATAPVGSFAANSLGLYDLAGNVWEWCSDRPTADGGLRLVRGGSFHNFARESFLTSQRGSVQPAVHHNDKGFRVVLAPVAKAPAPPPVSANPPPAGPSASANSATKDAPFVNTLGMKFVPVPITGGPTDGQRILFSIWETRVQDYEVNASEARVAWVRPSFEQGPTHPVVGVTWEDARRFCAWLTERERQAHRIGPTDRYRLPSDHEWSCAIGIGDREDPAEMPEEKHQKLKVYPWGATWPPPPGAGNFRGEEAAGTPGAANQKVIPGYNDGFPYTAPVGSFAPNALGLYDLAGNVAEYCEDWSKPESGRRTERMSSFRQDWRDTHYSSSRDFPNPTSWSDSSGFRVVLAGAPPHP